MAVAGCGRVGFDPFGEVADASTDADVDAGPPPRCASNPDYTARAGQSNTYREIVDQAWQQGFDACIADEAHLAVPDNAAEAAAIANTLTGMWIGVDDRATEDVWMTALGEPASYLPWGTSEPNGKTNENCVELPPDRSFNDLDCIAHRSAICECEVP